MAYDLQLAEKVRKYLAVVTNISIQEKRMFGGLAFLVDEKMCVNISGPNLMCRFDPEETTVLSKKTGFKPMIMKGKELAGYCYIEPTGINSKKDFEFWMKQCLEYNKLAKASVAKKKNNR